MNDRDFRASYLCDATNAQDYIAVFERSVERTLEQFTYELIRNGNAIGVIAAGSIPLGIGSHASDVDLIFLVRDQAISLDDLRASPGVVFVGSIGVGEKGDDCVNVIRRIGALEIDCIMVTSTCLAKLHQRVSQSNHGLTSQQRKLLSRVKTGWPLYIHDEFLELVRDIQADLSLEITSGTSSFVAAIQDLYDAEAALQDCPMLAISLLRSSLDMALLALWSSRGIAHIGTKWLRMTVRGRVPSELIALIDQATKLLFYPIAPDGDVAAYHAAIASFLVAIARKMIEHPEMEIAFQMCPQIPAKYSLSASKAQAQGSSNKP